jgi:hypothetical protein
MLDGRWWRTHGGLTGIGAVGCGLAVRAVDCATSLALATVVLTLEPRRALDGHVDQGQDHPIPQIPCTLRVGCLIRSATSEVRARRVDRLVANPVLYFRPPPRDFH